MIKKMLLILFLLCFCTPVFANDIEEVEAFFEKYVSAANSYSANLPSYYTSDAKIIRVVIKPNGSTATLEIPTARYFKQMRMMRNFARLKGYKNAYANRVVTQEGADYKLSADRTPRGDKTSLPCYFIIGKDSTGARKIKTESMHTKDQSFLKYVK